MNDYINIEGARVNNLKNISLKIERNKLTVISGISGSGKSSLAFDTLFAEGQRRFAESLSSFARQFLGRMSKPAVDKIEGIPPAIAIEQKVSSRNPRSTVGTNTEIYDYLRLLFSKIGKTYSPISGKEVKKESRKDVVNFITGLPEGTTVYLLAPINWKDAEYRTEKLLNLKEDGFIRLFDNGEIYRIDAVLSNSEEYADRDLKLLVDRITASDEEESVTRMEDSVQSAFKKGEGYLQVWYNDTTHLFSNLLEADGMLFEEPSELLFSFNNPIGACKHCGGYGKIIGIDEKLVFPDVTLSIYQGAILPWKGETMKHNYDKLINSAAKFDFPIHKPYNDLTKAQKRVLWTGNEYFEGLDSFFKAIDAKKYKIQFLYMLKRYSGKSVCPECLGSRLCKEAHYVKVGGETISDLLDLSIKNLSIFFNELQLDEYDAKLGERAITEIVQRLSYIESVGLSYLTLSRASNTLSGGESQRINLVSAIGSNLVGSLYILDEPSIGLHPKDTQRLISVLKRLRDLGNSVVLVEHDEEILRSADELIDIGPYAGIAGGEIVYKGKVEDGIANNGSLTIDYLQGVRRIPIPLKKRDWQYSIEICGAVEHNLQNITVKFPLGVMTAVTGVSGSGKSTLVGDILYPAIFKHINQFGDKPGAFKEIKGDLSKISSVEYIDQNPIGKSSRSNPATYLKVYDDIRKLFAEQPYAKLNGYGPSHFSFNIDGGRCSECQGEGIITIPMQFMADVKMTCEACEGKRFKSDVLDVRYRDKNIGDILAMSVEEAISFFQSQPESLAKKIADKLQPLNAVGLSYVQLGQSSNSLSGGESQRIKLAYFLSKESSNEKILFIFDEPTTGLHFYDIEKLLNSFNALIDKGHSIIVVEHNLDVIRACDWVIDLGPDGGENGGNIVFEGRPEELAKHTEIYTGEFLSKLY